MTLNASLDRFFDKVIEQFHRGEGAAMGRLLASESLIAHLERDGFIVMPITTLAELTQRVEGGFYPP